MRDTIKHGRYNKGAAMIKECSSDRYFERLSAHRPAVWIGKGFLVGEPIDHRKCQVTGIVLPTYAAFFFAHRRYYEGDSMTMPEFHAFELSSLP